MGRRGGESPLEMLTELMGLLFRYIPPWTSIPIAGAGFLLIRFFGMRSFAANSPLVALGSMFGNLFGFLFVLACLAGGFLGWKHRRNQAAFLHQHIDLAWLNQLSWQDFERAVAEVYRQQGYEVEELGGGGADGGVDLKLRRGGELSVVQCKRWKVYKVGVQPVRELFGVMAAERANRAIFITSGVYTFEALRFAEGQPIDLVDGAQFAQMMRAFQQTLAGQQMLAGKRSSTVTVPQSPTCPVCQSAMVLRRAKVGVHAGREFWGCSTFPRCRGTVDIR